MAVEISARDDQIRIQGADGAVARATEVLEQLKSLVHRQGSIEADQVAQILSDVTGQAAAGSAAPIEVLNAGRKVVPRTTGQARYVQAIADHDIVFCTGPAGTGKTYLAVAMAVASLKQERIKKIVLVRPRSRPVKAWATCPAICKRRSILTCDRCWMHCAR